MSQNISLLTQENSRWGETVCNCRKTFLKITWSENNPVYSTPVLVGAIPVLVDALPFLMDVIYVLVYVTPALVDASPVLRMHYLSWWMLYQC